MHATYLTKKPAPPKPASPERVDAGRVGVPRFLRDQGMRFALKVSQADDAHEKEASEAAGGRALRRESVADAPGDATVARRPKALVGLGERASKSRHPDEIEAERAAKVVTNGSVSGLARKERLTSIPVMPSPSVRSEGHALPLDERKALEEAFGVGLGAVRIHDSPQERGHAVALGAAAFASGSHIVHARSGSMPTRHVLAHEIAHIIQSAFEPRSPAIRCYESPEHEDLGDAALDDLLAFLRTAEGVEWARTQGLDAKTLTKQIEADPLRRAGGKIELGTREVEGDGRETVGLTPGQIIALAGDFYRGPDEIASAAGKRTAKPAGTGKAAKAGKPSEIDRLIAAIEDERKGRLSDPHQTYESITGGRYLSLAKQNDEHFAPKNRIEWKRLHDQALAEAASAGSDPARLNHALLIDASGGHFLTDAYASGHLFKKGEVLAAIQAHLARHPLSTYNPEAQIYAAIVTWSGNAAQLVLKNIHDRMNREGFEITNGRGMQWRSFGDALLSKAPDTQRIAALAIFTSRQQVYAASRGERPDPQEVLDLMPDDATVDRATAQAIAYIDEAASAQAIQELMYHGRKLAGTQFPFPLGPIIESNLATITNPAREKQLHAIEEGSRGKNFGPMLAPQFTIFDFP